MEIRKLHKSYKDLLKFNVAKRELPRFKKKEELFLDQLHVLFNITVKSLIPSNLITAEDRSFLLHNWDKTISSTLDVTTKQAVEKKLVRHEKSRKFTSSHSIVAPVSDRLSLTHNQLTVITAALVNHCGGDIQQVYISAISRQQEEECSHNH